MYMHLVHVFVYLACITFCLFSLPLGVRGWLYLVIVALPGLFMTQWQEISDDALWVKNECHFLIGTLQFYRV